MKVYFNRELSWLKFNERVLDQASQEDLPILDRFKFNAIFSSNLDEFFMVRVASILEQIKADYLEPEPSGLTPKEAFEAIGEDVLRLLEKQDQVTRACFDELEKQGIRFVRRGDFDEKLLPRMKEYFDNEVFPVLTPMAVDFGRPFPFVTNKSLHIVSKIFVDNQFRLALVKVPDVISRFVPFKVKDEIIYVLLEDLIIQFMDQLFIGHQIVHSSVIRLTRNADLDLIEDDADDLLMVIEEAVKKRKWGGPIRLEIEAGIDPWVETLLKQIFNLENSQIYYFNQMMDLTAWFGFKHGKSVKKLKSEAFKPRLLPFMKKKNVFKLLRDQDVFLHHPYDSFDLVVRFIEQASVDPKVLAIKQTLYRVSGNSAIIKALAEAADRGKQVTVLVELMARFDEENNIQWAKQLERKGVHVIYGIYGLKTHSKITLVVRKEGKRIRRYVHLGTGNYNDQTAKLYTDMGYLTCREEFGTDATIFFNMVSGFSSAISTQHFHVSPHALRKSFYQLIDVEIRNAREGKEGLIIAKMNALVDKGMVDKLYEASQAGVKIQLIVRGICTLVPGVPGLSENITVRSIIGEFLEHSRIYYFHNNHHPKLFLASADWMSRNLNRRVELMFPIADPVIAERIWMILALYLKDNKRAWELKPDGHYKRVKASKKKGLCAHEVLKSLDYENNEDFISAIKRLDIM
jgi:polyphosphate kinase